jgi:hypothetical protein
MSSRRILIYLVIAFLVLAAMRPRETWRQAQQMWSQRGYLMAVLVTTIVIYLVYGLYQMYQQGYFLWD